jgi:hypothetical protein
MSTDAQSEFMEYAKSFSEAEWDDAVAFAELGHALYRGLTVDAEIQFVRAAIEGKRVNPSAPGGDLINAGLVAIGKPPITYKRKKARGKLAGAGI